MGKLREGQMAPAFETVDHFGAPVSLKALRGQRVLLSFYRYASCPLCNLRVNALIRQYPALAGDGLRVIGVVQSPAAEIARYVGRQDAPFPFVPDPKQLHYKRWGVEPSWRGFFVAATKLGKVVDAAKAGFWPGWISGPMHQMPADFLIDEAGRLVRCHYGQDAGDHLDFADIVAFARSGRVTEGV
ncbi:peroxiredoxin-like family protein [Devosia sp.]|uniref:peroxiredoxin-like family protein n=1 Tax=Devosia sp. TaxID=1871048 RepID=UPI003A90EFEE